MSQIEENLKKNPKKLLYFQNYKRDELEILTYSYYQSVHQFQKDTAS